MKIAESDQDILACFDVLKELREDLVRDAFVPRVQKMRKQGYALAFHEAEGEVVSVAGFRLGDNLFAGGNALYVYDLVTAHKHRSKGYGDQLIEALCEHARAHDCKIIHLDSGVHRFRAHKFYLSHGFEIRAHHFVRSLQ